jgi:hypothetical protein
MPSEGVWATLEIHHTGEDELLYPLLGERAPEHQALFARMEEQHHAVVESIQSAQAIAQAFGKTGAVAEATDAESQAVLFEKLLPPVQNMWIGGGATAFGAEMAAIRLGAF